jgi:hypothetical protein
MARPVKEINQIEFEKLCGLQCTRDEICGWFGVTDKTLDGWCKRTYGEGFSAVYDKKREAGRISLRRAQFQLAQKSAAMAIFLGKQYLGQRDTPVEIAHTVSPIDAITAEIFRVQEEQRDAEQDAEQDDDIEC